MVNNTFGIGLLDFGGGGLFFFFVFLSKRTKSVALL